MDARAQDPTVITAVMAVLSAVQKATGPQLLGTNLMAARVALRNNLLGEVYPGFWLETPLFGEPGFDFHVSYDRPDLAPDALGAALPGFEHQRLVDWFMDEETGGVGLGFAHDILTGPAGGTAVYVNTNHRPLASNAGFFAAAGHRELAPAVESFLCQLPESFRVWYLGVFAQREGSPARVGCFLPDEVRLLCQKSPAQFARELAHIGFAATSPTMLEQLGALAQIPLGWEMQFDVYANGRVGEVLSVDLCLPVKRGVRADELFACEGLGGRAMQVLEAWGVADERWHLLRHTSLSRLVRPRSENAAFLQRCHPVFIKAKWEAGEPRAAKVYLECMTRPVTSSTWDRLQAGRPSH